MAVYNGTSNGDFIQGSSSSDTINGYDGADSLLGMDGADFIYGGSGNDSILDGDGQNPDLYADTLFGNDGDDWIYAGYLDNADGGIGYDTLILRLDFAPAALVADFTGIWSGSTFTIDGATIQGFEAFHWIRGTQFNDYITAGTPVGKTAELDGFTGSDVLIGGAGNDILTAGVLATDADYDELYGLDGNDLLQAGLGDHVEGGLGSDRLTFDAGISAAGVSLSFGTLLATGSATIAGTYLSSIEDISSVSGSSFADTIDASTDDYSTSVYGRGGNDILKTGSGANTLDGGAGADTMEGGTGNDEYYVDQSGDVVTEGLNAGNDIVRSSVTYTLGANVEQLVLTGASAINGTGNSLANNMFGNDSANTLSGGDGDDTLNGAGGNDILNGGNGINILDGGTGADTMTGGTSNDTFYVDNTSDIVSETGGGGLDLVYSSVTHTLAAGVENLTLTGAAAINGAGNTSVNDISGNSAANALAGGAGDDTLRGMDGADTLTGGAGKDFLIGGNGADSFAFANGDMSGTTSSTADYIYDFNRAQGDKINLSAVDAVTGGLDNAFAFIGTSAFSGVAGQLRYQIVSTTTTIYGDLNGDSVADFAISLNGSVALLASDFFL